MIGAAALAVADGLVFTPPAVRLVTYTPEHFPLVAQVAAVAPGARSLGHRPFVDHYYGSRDWCHLYLALDRDDQVSAVVGLEQIPFEQEGRLLTLTCGSNLATLRPGAGGVLFLHWVRSSDYACVFGGSADTHKMLQRQRWTYFPGIRTMRLNRAYVAREGERWWRAAAKTALRVVQPGVNVARRARAVAGSVEAVEQARVTPEMLPDATPFTFRMRPTVDYLNWRYDGGLSFVRYRCFRLVTDRTRGYVIVNDRPDAIMVAQADADDPATLAAGIMAAVGRVAGARGPRRQVVLTCAHREMAAMFRGFGFRADPVDRPFAIGSGKHPVDLSTDTSRWLINFDWIDNGLRAPFLDQAAAMRIGTSR